MSTTRLPFSLSMTPPFSYPIYFQKRRSAINAAAIAMNRIQHAWESRETAPMLLMDVKGAFGHVSKPRILARMKKINIDGDLIRWTSSFLEDRQITLVIDRFTGLSNPSHHIPEWTISRCRKELLSHSHISYAEDVAWLAVGRDVQEVKKRLENAAIASKTWAVNNTVEFNISKTEAILFFRKNDKRYGLREYPTYKDQRRNPI